jgi:hypothetical protein
MKPSAASFCTNRSISAATWAGVPMNDCLPLTSMIRSRMLSCFDSASARHSRAVANGSAVRLVRPG